MKNATAFLSRPHQVITLITATLIAVVFGIAWFIFTGAITLHCWWKEQPHNPLERFVVMVLVMSAIWLRISYMLIKTGKPERWLTE